MAIVIAELIASRTGNPSKQTLQYKVAGVTGSDDDARVFEAVMDTSPMSHNGLARQDEEIKIEPQGNGLWFAEVPYKRKTVEWETDQSSGGNEVKGPEFSWDTTGGTHHLDYSRQTRSSQVEYVGSPFSTAPDFENLIGVNDGEVAGTDVVVPQLEFSERHFLADGLITFDYVTTLRDLTGTVNKAAFRGFAAGEVLFLGARGSRNEPGQWSVEFFFAASKNLENFEIGGIRVSIKEGWDYLWVLNREELDETAKYIIKKPVAAYVEVVYEKTDFSRLGISVPVLGASAPEEDR